MSTPSTLLLCAGAAASLVGVWTLAGLSETSTLRSNPRVLAAGGVGLLCEAVVYGRSPVEVRAELWLPLLFATACVLATAVGAAKLEAALLDKDGPRAVRRAAGVVAGTFFGMAAVGAASLDLSSGSLALARVSWALMFGLVAATLVVFAERARYAGAGLLSLGSRALPLALVAVALVAGARLTAAAAPAIATSVPPSPVEPSAVVSASAPDASGVAPAPSEAAPPVAASADGVPSAAASAEPPAPSAEPSAAPLAAAPTAPADSGLPQIDAVTVRGVLEADARGGVTRRMDRLQACLAEPKNQQKGSLSLKIGVDASGSVTYSKAMAGDLKGTPLGNCWLAVFYKMGFAATRASNANFEITLRTP